MQKAFCFKGIEVFTMKKGIALTTESVIIIILAVIVLVALILFLTDVWNPSKIFVDDTSAKARWCSKYINLYPKCDTVPDTYPTLLDDMETVCECGQMDEIQCIKNCCGTLCTD